MPMLFSFIFNFEFQNSRESVLCALLQGRCVSVWFNIIITVKGEAFWKLFLGKTLNTSKFKLPHILSNIFPCPKLCTVSLCGESFCRYVQYLFWHWLQLPAQLFWGQASDTCKRKLIPKVNTCTKGMVLKVSPPASHDNENERNWPYWKWIV